MRMRKKCDDACPGSDMFIPYIPLIKVSIQVIAAKIVKTPIIELVLIFINEL